MRRDEMFLVNETTFREMEFPSMEAWEEAMTEANLVAGMREVPVIQFSEPGVGLLRIPLRPKVDVERLANLPLTLTESPPVEAWKTAENARAKAFLESHGRPLDLPALTEEEAASLRAKCFDLAQELITCKIPQARLYAANVLDSVLNAWNCVDGQYPTPWLFNAVARALAAVKGNFGPVSFETSPGDTTPLPCTGLRLFISW